MILNRRTLFSLSNAAKEKSNAQVYSISTPFRHSPQLVYALISRVDLYHEFIPYCTSSFIKHRDQNLQPIEAGLRVGFQSFDEEFTCALDCTLDKSVRAESISHSLFHKLSTTWTIDPLNTTTIQGSRAKLDLEFEFKSDLYNRVSKLFANKVANLMSKAFQQRALEVYQNDLLLQKYGMQRE